MRMRRVDLVKGILIILVITGHLLPADRHASLLRWMIYSIHMPLFAAVSGFLFPWQEIKQLPITTVLCRYWRRPILPWLVALGVYSTISGTSPLHPFFHLWFIPAYLLWAFLSWTLVRTRLSWPWIIVIAAIISLVSAYSSYYIFFALGGFFRWNKQSLPTRFVASPTALLLAIRIALFYFPDPLVEQITFVALNIGLLRLMVLFMERHRNERYPLLEWIGENSLGIYLWHVLPLIIVFRLHFDSAWLATGVNTISLFTLFVIIRMTLRLPVVNRLFYGI
jgi:acyltransferase